MTPSKDKFRKGKQKNTYKIECYQPIEQVENNSHIPGLVQAFPIGNDGIVPVL